MGKNDWILPVVLLAGGYIWYSRYGGKAVIDDLLGNLKGGSSQVNTGQNISGNVDAGHIQSQVQSMLEKMGVHGSGQSINRTRQIDTTGQAKQSQTHIQHSTTLFTRLTRFGNL